MGNLGSKNKKDLNDNIQGSKKQAQVNLSNEQDNCQGKDEAANQGLHRDNSHDEHTEEESALELAYKDQGYHEMEFTSKDESELHQKKGMCLKNPGHAQFIPAKKFTKKHLPDTWRDNFVLDLITVMISLTVRLTVKYTSLDRPKDYPLYNRRGKFNLIAFGSGMVRAVCRKFMEEDGRTCPCEKCKLFPQDVKKQWGEFEVHTAMHVVYDESEVRYTQCNLFFDCDKDRYSCPNLEGVDIVRRNIGEDSCYMRCITHDQSVSSKLEAMVDRYEDIRSTLYSKGQRNGHGKQTDTAVVISHPHGLAKYVTVGELTGRQEVYPRKWIYRAQTCTGSSGAPVLILREKDIVTGVSGPYYSTHSGSEQKGYNESSSMCVF